MTSGTAPGKIILLGEHAVVYGRPALAAPLSNLIVEANLVEQAEPGFLVHSVDLGQQFWLAEAEQNNPLAQAIWLTLEALDQPDPPAAKLTIKSSLPIAAGLGSGAAVSVAIIRALSLHLGAPLRPEEQSALAYQVEKLHHGTPSGIDNTVIAHGAPVYFVKDKTMTTLDIGAPFELLIADSGVSTPTSEAVAGVRRRWQEAQSRYEGMFDEIGKLADQARRAIAAGEIGTLGYLMDQNQTLLFDIGVSSPELETLVEAARRAGALGAKLSGGGLGGNMIALIDPSKAGQVSSALERAGAVRVLHARVDR